MEFDATLHIQNIRREEVKQKEIKIMERIENADQYIKTMQEKQCQASRRLKNERELRLQKEKELQALKEELQQLTVRRDRLRKRVKKNEVYADFVTGVVKSSNQFQDTRQLISHFDMMTKMKKELLQNTQRTQTAAETIRAQLKQRIDQNSDRILQCNNKLAELQRQLDAARTESQLWDSKWAHIQNTAAKKTLSLGAIKMATMNIYQNVCKKARDEVIAVDDTMKQLDKVTAQLQIITYTPSTLAAHFISSTDHIGAL
ncbi:hypothetical protein NFI96_033024, partial [Prochilodus magdalenae]